MERAKKGHTGRAEISSSMPTPSELPDTRPCQDRSPPWCVRQLLSKCCPRLQSNHINSNHFAQVCQFAQIIRYDIIILPMPGGKLRFAVTESWGINVITGDDLNDIGQTALEGT